MDQGFEPLASLLRPKTAADYVGQEHLLGNDAPITKMLENQQCYSMLLWGPPGTGKTSLIEVIKNTLDAELIVLSAINSGVKDIRAAVDAPADIFNRRRIVFVDEIHRFNKSQQDAFLPFVESGQITLFGATTENPSFSINRALLSRMRVFVLKPLTTEALHSLVDKATTHIRAHKKIDLSFDSGVLESFIEQSEGDARRLLLSIEIATDSVESDGVITRDIAANALGVKTLSYDKQGDAHFDLLSAFHKSIRGSNQDAALYWFVRLLESGGDISVIARRLLAIASEDIGNADPKAIQVCLSAWDVYHRVGPAEGERAIAQAVIYSALAPKSNAVYAAFKKAKRDVAELPNYPVPLHLRNAPSKLAKSLDHGKDYKYAHNYEHAYVAAEQYLPPEMQNSRYYEPCERGFEKTLKQKMAFLAHLDEQSALSKDKS